MSMRLVAAVAVMLILPAPGHCEEPSELLELATDYLRTVYTSDFDSMAGYYTEASVWEDPTMAVFGEPVRLEGGKAIPRDDAPGRGPGRRDLSRFGASCYTVYGD